ncbi:MAG: serine/threonine protein kinase [Planctomycetia bacterium]|nr:serine/threonine protein kinase [Planctomycetia bacterium]
MPRVLMFAFVAAIAFAPAAVSRCFAAETPATTSRFLFTSQGKTGHVEADQVRYLDFQAPDQVTWQPGGMFKDGRRIVVLSMEQRRDGPGKPFEVYYTQTPTHLWTYDLISGDLQEIGAEHRLATFVTPQLLLKDEERMLVQVVRGTVGQTYSVRLDGSDPREFTKAGEGLPYGLSLSPDGQRVAYHLASPEGYQVWNSDVEGGDRIKVAASPAHLYFGTCWSPDGQWILYVDCHYQQDPGHDWADVCIGRADGSEHRVLTSDQAMWFAATYGSPETRGGGSNVPSWTHDGKILFPRRTPGARVAWEYQPDRPDTDHFNRDYKPESAQGGTEICLLDPVSGKVESLTPSEPSVWDFRAGESPDGKEIVFCRAAVGEAPAIWVMNRDGSNARLITRGIDDHGADHPRWLPLGR